MSTPEPPAVQPEHDEHADALALAKADLRYLRSWVAESQAREHDLAEELEALRTSEATAREQAESLHAEVTRLRSEVAEATKALAKSEARHAAVLSSTTYRTGQAIRESASLRGMVHLPGRLLRARRPQPKTRDVS